MVALQRASSSQAHESCRCFEADRKQRMILSLAALAPHPAHLQSGCQVRNATHRSGKSCTDGKCSKGISPSLLKTMWFLCGGKYSWNVRVDADDFDIMEKIAVDLMDEAAGNNLPDPATPKQQTYLVITVR